MVYSVASSAGVQPSQPGAKSARRAWTLAAILAGGALAVRLWCFTGLIASDDVVYAHYAHALATGRYSLEANHLALRFGLLLPVAASYALLGISEATTALVPLLASVASAVLVFFIARRQFGLAAGVIAYRAPGQLSVVHSLRQHSRPGNGCGVLHPRRRLLVPESLRKRTARPQQPLRE